VENVVQLRPVVTQSSFLIVIAGQTKFGFVGCSFAGPK